jgi:hypothetical protein
MGKKAMAFYADRKSEAAGVTIAQSSAITVGISAGLIRMFVLIVLPIVVAVVGLLTGTEVGGGRWLTAFFGLLAVSALLTLAYVGWRWLRHRRRRRLATA